MLDVVEAIQVYEIDTHVIGLENGRSFSRTILSTTAFERRAAESILFRMSACHVSLFSRGKSDGALAM